jgi:Pro-kumamolisin, activation domain/Bacterial Ig-like domain (group 1)
MDLKIAGFALAYAATRRVFRVAAVAALALCGGLSGSIPANAGTRASLFSTTGLAALIHAAAPAVVVDNDRVRLTGHVLPALAHAAPTFAPKELSASPASQSLTLTFVLKRDDEAGFQRYLSDVYDSHSASYRRFLSQAELSQHFGPSLTDYQQVLSYLTAQGFQLIEGSPNHMTLTVRGTRAQAEQTFAVHVGDYRLADRNFYANDNDPALPRDIASHVQAVVGLSNLATPRSIHKEDLDNVCNFVGIAAGVGIPFTAGAAIPFVFAVASSCFLANLVLMDINALNATPGSGYSNPFGGSANGTNTPLRSSSLAIMNPAANGAGQTIGLLEFDNYLTSDVNDYLNLLTQVGIPAGQLSNLSEVHVNGGTSPGAEQSEVLLDIDTVLTLAPGARVVVYDAPFTGAGTSFQSVFNAMINGGVTIISNSWAYCEDQTTLADVQSIDSMLQNAAAAGISVLSGAGDTGSTCLDGSTNTVSVPADSPHATAVGGTSLTAAKGYVYGSETYWNGTAATQPTGQGGFGISRFFTRPSFQDGLNLSAMRSVPDVAINADPAQGFSICQASAGGCPTGLLYGGTSLATPIAASFTALLNQTQGINLGNLNASVYPLANTSAFHSAASMGSDFAHVGLGSPNIGALHQLLSGQTVGVPSATRSKTVYTASVIGGTQIPVPFPSVPADGTSEGVAVVALLDAKGNSVSGKLVTLAANGGSHAVITPGSGLSTVANGTVVFSVTDSTSEPLILTATDTTDGITLQQTASIAFAPPPATSADIVAFTDAVAADGVSSDLITVTLSDALGRASPGKRIALSQNGNSVASAPNPTMTDASGQIQFSVTDTVQETITYTAVDVSDGELPVPGSAVVTFNFSGGDNCGATHFANPDITAADGYAITPYATGFVPRVTNFGGLADGCRGASGLAFDSSGNLFVSDIHSGYIYKFAPGGGVAGPGTVVNSTTLGPGIETLTFGLDGRLYAAQNATTGNFFTGAVMELDPTNGTIVKITAPGITCASFLVTDPISGDLFVDDSCSGAGSDNGSIWRIANPAASNPTISVYATTPGVNGGVTFSPGGSLYVIDYLENDGVAKIGGTATPPPAQKTVLPGLTGSTLNITAVGAQPNGDAQTLILGAPADTLGFPAGIKTFDVTTNPVTTTSILVNNAFANVEITGPDGCQYASVSTAVYKITNADGTCPLVLNAPAISLTPPNVSPNPAQGTKQSFTATFHYANAPAQTPVRFIVTGANPMMRSVNSDATGHATFSYAAVNAGKDAIVASATLTGTTIASQPARVTWEAGIHTTFLDLNNAPTSGNSGRAVNLTAVLSDVSVEPVAAISGATIQFTIGSRSYTGVTNINGVAAVCAIVSAGGNFSLVAAYAGNSQYLPATSSQGFSALPTDAIFYNGFDSSAACP